MSLRDWLYLGLLCTLVATYWYYMRVWAKGDHKTYQTILVSSGHGFVEGSAE